MSETYVTLKIREALTVAQGSRSQAQRVLMAWALDDEQLLRGLCRPFLKAITGSAIARMAGSGAGGRAAPPAAASPSPRSAGPKKLPPQMLDAIIARMGNPGASPAAPADEGDQAEALKSLAKAFKRPL
ncbi:hypothetical protein [Oleisolibacter albus]|uniref:hypothetical protein n=1 Tax=Oleisolibacter albus TaxID=2171757 RepID=UPI000DF485BF|nr:hypothetical protein [Oleisolibacter albus]